MRDQKTTSIYLSTMYFLINVFLTFDRHRQTHFNSSRNTLLSVEGINRESHPKIDFQNDRKLDHKLPRKWLRLSSPNKTTSDATKLQASISHSIHLFLPTTPAVDRRRSSVLTTKHVPNPKNIYLKDAIDFLRRTPPPPPAKSD